MPRTRYRVTGIVQGVGFRWYVREKARRLGLHGWVRNLEDGDVEIAVEGPDEQLAFLLAAVREGPDGARVDEVVTLPVGDLQALDAPFSVRR